MKKTMFAFVLLTVFSSCIMKTASETESGYRSTERDFSFAQSYVVAAPLNLSLSTSGGNIEVVGTDGDSVCIRFVVQKNNGKVLDVNLEELRELAQVEITQTGGTLSVAVRNVRPRINVGFMVTAPRNATTLLSTSGGNVRVGNLSGDQKVSTSGGNIHLNDIAGNLNARTSGGNIHMENLKGTTDVATSGGNISGENLTGNLSARTSGGNIRMDGVTGDAEVSTSGGNVHLEGISGSMSARTSGGNVHAEISKLTGRLSLQTNGGDIDCVIPRGLGLDLNLSAGDIHAELDHFQGTSKERKVVGQMNGGGIPVDMSCPSGSIRMEYR